jgi:hypothetical protein
MVLSAYLLLPLFHDLCIGRVLIHQIVGGYSLWRTVILNYAQAIASSVIGVDVTLCCAVAPEPLLRVSLIRRPSKSHWRSTLVSPVAVAVSAPLAS